MAAISPVVVDYLRGRQCDEVMIRKAEPEASLAVLF